MKPDELTDIMRRRGMRQIDVAWVCGVGVRHVRSWLRGVYPIPQYVLLLMRAIDQDLIDTAYLVTNIEADPPVVTP